MLTFLRACTIGFFLMTLSFSLASHRCLGPCRGLGHSSIVFILKWSFQILVRHLLEMHVLGSSARMSFCYKSQEGNYSGSSVSCSELLHLDVSRRAYSPSICSSKDKSLNCKRILLSLSRSHHVSRFFYRNRKLNSLSSRDD